MRSIMFAIALVLPSAAFAQDFTWQARVLSASGAPIEGSHRVRFVLRDADAGELWNREYQSVSFSRGYASQILSGVDDASEPLDAAWFLDDVYLSIALDGGDELPSAMALSSVPSAAAVDGAVRLSASGVCNPGNSGGLRYANGTIELCDGSTWQAVSSGSPATGDGSDAANAGSTCSSILSANPGASTGTFFVDPDGSGGYPAFPVHCDMTGGGWTPFLRIDTSGNQQITGSGRNGFWINGGNLDASMALSGFTGLEQSQEGFVGWDRMAGWAGDIRVRVVGVNERGQSVDQQFVARGLGVDTGDRQTDLGALDGGGTWTASVMHDIDTRSGWGACGTGTANNQHVGFALCSNGFDGNIPSGSVVQIWHYGNWSDSVNLSFGNAGSGTNFTHPGNRGSASVTLSFQPL